MKTREPKPPRHKPTAKMDREVLKRDVETLPDAYHYERADRLGVSDPCMGYALKHPKADPEKRSIQNAIKQWPLY